MKLHFRDTKIKIQFTTDRAETNPVSERWQGGFQGEDSPLGAASSESSGEHVLGFGFLVACRRWEQEGKLPGAECQRGAQLWG